MIHRSTDPSGPITAVSRGIKQSDQDDGRIVDVLFGVAVAEEVVL